MTVHNEFTIGKWAAYVSALFAVCWFVTFNMQDVFQAVPHWKDMEAYASSFQIVRLTLIYPSLLLALSYMLLMVCLYRLVSEEKKLWALFALCLGVLYATMASINYNIQAVSVRASLAVGETGGIQMFIPDNPNSIYTALANSYVYMSLSMFFAGLAFTNRGRERWIRWLLMAQLVSAVGQTGYSMCNLPESVFIATSMVWVIGAPLAFILMGRWFGLSQAKQ